MTQSVNGPLHLTINRRQEKYPTTMGAHALRLSRNFEKQRRKMDLPVSFRRRTLHLGYVPSQLPAVFPQWLVRLSSCGGGSCLSARAKDSTLICKGGAIRCGSGCSPIP